MPPVKKGGVGLPDPSIGPPPFPPGANSLQTPDPSATWGEVSVTAPRPQPAIKRPTKAGSVKSILAFQAKGLTWTRRVRPLTLTSCTSLSISFTPLRVGPRVAGVRLRGGYVEGVPHLASRVTFLVAPRGHGGKVLGLLLLAWLFLLARPSGPALACWVPDCFPPASHPVLPAEPRHPGPGEGKAGVFGR